MCTSTELGLGLAEPLSVRSGPSNGLEEDGEVAWVRGKEREVEEGEGTGWGREREGKK